MPILVDAEIHHLDQDEFGRIAYNFMEHAFAVHNEMGRFFNEDIYRDAVAARIADSRTEVRVEVRFEDFRTEYFIDLLVSSGGVFELMTAKKLGGSHRS